MKIIQHDIVDDKRGHSYDLYFVEIENATSDELGTLNADRLPTIATAAVLTDGTQTVPTLTLFYQSTGIRLTSATLGDQMTIVARQDRGTPGANANIPPARGAS